MAILWIRNRHVFNVTHLSSSSGWRPWLVCSRTVLVNEKRSCWKSKRLSSLYRNGHNYHERLPNGQVCCFGMPRTVCFDTTWIMCSMTSFLFWYISQIMRSSCDSRSWNFLFVFWKAYLFLLSFPKILLHVVGLHTVLALGTDMT